MDSLTEARAEAVLAFFNQAQGLGYSDFPRSWWPQIIDAVDAGRLPAVIKSHIEHIFPPLTLLEWRMEGRLRHIEKKLNKLLEAKHG